MSKRHRKERHPVVTAVGAATAGAAGAVAGAAVGGPVGAIAGGLAGAAAGAVAGNSFAAEFDATEEERYWREHFADRPYRRLDRGYEWYAPAYRYGWESARKIPPEDGRTFEEVEEELKGGWLGLGGMVADETPAREWHEAREAVRDAWNRIRGG
jgi:hypothetical protein